MRRKLPQHVYYERTRHGALSLYFRRGHGKRLRLRAAFDTKEFWAEYHAAMAGTAPEDTAPAVKAHTLQWALDRYRRESSGWAEFSVGTRRAREHIIRAVIRKAGDFRLDRIDGDAVKRGMQERRATPHAANNFLKTLRHFFAWAVSEKLLKADPSFGVKRLRGRNPAGFITWTDEDVGRFEARWPIGTRERLALDLLLYSGVRRGDLVRLGRQHIKGDRIELRTEKSRFATEVQIPLLPVLKATIEATPTGDLTFLPTARGTGFVKESFGTWFAEACKQAGVSGRAHGLRKLGAVRAAERGATVPELMAIFGWKDPKMAIEYIRKADRKKLAERADVLLAPRQVENKQIPHLDPGAGNGAKKTV